MKARVRPARGRVIRGELDEASSAATIRHSGQASSYSAPGRWPTRGSDAACRWHGTPGRCWPMDATRRPAQEKTMKIPMFVSYGAVALATLVAAAALASCEPASLSAATPDYSAAIDWSLL